MAKIGFIYHIHDTSSPLDVVDNIHDQMGEEIGVSKEELDEYLDHPFDEVKLECELDTETFEVTIVNASIT